MENREFYKAKIEAQLAKWKTTMDGLKEKIEQAEADAKTKLHEQWAGLHDQRAKAEELLERLGATGQETWEQVRSQVEQGWSEISRAARKTANRVREGITAPNHDEEIRQIAYHLWLDEGCPQGLHHEHWLKAEEIWRARQSAQPADNKPRTARARKTPAAPRTGKTTGRTASRSRREPPTAGK